MNIFRLDDNPAFAARYQCDQHVVKMCLETAQLLCTAVPRPLYRRTHMAHPCAIWTRATLGNFIWLYDHGRALAAEYELRYGRPHACLSVMRDCWDQRMAMPPNPVDSESQTRQPRCMPLQFKRDDVVDSYRRYYRSKQYTMLGRFSYSVREKPEWL